MTGHEHGQNRIMGDVCGAQFQPSGLEFVPESLCLTVVHEATIKSIQQNIIGGCIICPVPHRAESAIQIPGCIEVLIICIVFGDVYILSSIICCPQ